MAQILYNQGSGVFSPITADMVGALADETVPINKGGTGATSAETARSNLGALRVEYKTLSGDLNDYNESGLYSLQPTTNSPITGGYWVSLLVNRVSNNSQYVTQMLYSLDNSKLMYIRFCSGGVWSDWRIIYTWTELWHRIYPVGAVYISYVSTSPASLFGGTWTPIMGRFPYFNAGTATGGANSQTLTVSQMPKHSHALIPPGAPDFWMYGHDWNTGGAWSAGSSATYQIVDRGTGYAGKGEAINNMPAYQTFYAWRRTA